MSAEVSRIPKKKKKKQLEFYFGNDVTLYSTII